MKTPINMSTDEMLAELASFGIESNGEGPIQWMTAKGKRKTQPRGVLAGMLERQRSRAAAFAAGAMECVIHHGEAEGDCPICPPPLGRGIWAPD